MHRSGVSAAAHVRPATWSFLLALVAVAVLAGGRAGAAVPSQVPQAGAVATARVLAGLDAAPRLAPASQVGASLADEVTALAHLLGVPLQPDEVARQIDAAGLAPRTTAALAGLVARLSTCSRASADLLATTSLPALAAGAAADTAALQTCAIDLRAETDAALAALAGDTAAEDESIRIWPVLAYSPDEKSADVYREDYALVVDRGGNDRYLNNQGGNAMDLKRSLSSPAARITAPARGCEAVFPDFTTGRLKRGPADERVHSFDGAECSPAAALLLDLGGDDHYGRSAQPGFPDSVCTDDHLVRRISTIGSGVAGVGMLIDTGGDDTYLGKTGTQGAGHLGGIGLLEDRAGDDTYRAIRGAQGLGLLDGIGVLHDLGGDDSYDYRMPRPLDPKAKNHTDGAGGVVDDTGLGSEVGLGQQPGNGVGGTCDRLERSLQGVGLLAGVGLLVDEAGRDDYRAPGYLNQPFFTVQGVTVIHLAHGSQGSGYLGGTGVFTDLAGRDRYRDAHGRASKSRANGETIGPRISPTPDGEGPTNGKPLDFALFHDSGS